jgi:hypothetical protein
MSYHFLLALWPYPFRVIQDMWWPESSQGYAVFSSIGGDTAILGAITVFYRTKNCHEPRCWRLGKHQVEGTPYTVCHRHHPLLEGSKVEKGHIQRAHEKYHKEIKQYLDKF